MNDNDSPAYPLPAMQVSRYPQDDGSDLFCVEHLHLDGTWDCLHHTRDEGRAWLLAGDAAHRNGVLLLPRSVFPSRGHRPRLIH